MADLHFSDVLMRIPPRTEPHLPRDWLHTEMMEREKVLSLSGVRPGDNVIEIGCGAHAITTVPLAFQIGKTGHVMAVEKERWQYFRQIVMSSGFKDRIDGMGCDARRLPLHSKSFDLALIVHGIRSLKDENTIIKVLREMIRVADRIFAAETLPIARTKAQAAHLEMYNLREEIFDAILGSKDDIHYPEFNALREMVERAGARITRSEILEVNMPHYLAFLPKEYVERIQNPSTRSDLLSRWEIAYKHIVSYGEGHPPVGVISAIPD